MIYRELEAALSILGLGQRASLAEIRNRYHQLAREHHPDGGTARESDQIQRINAAYRLLRDYCAGYRYDFGEAEFYEQDPEARLQRQFAEDPVWGGHDDQAG